MHSEGADAARGAIDEDLLARLEAPLIAKRLQRGEARDGDRRPLFKGDARWLGRQLRFRSTRIFGEGSPARAEHVVAWFEPGDVSAHLFHLAGHIDAELWRPWGSQSDADAKEVGHSPHEMPVQWVDRSRANLDQDFIVTGLWLFNFFTAQNAGGTVVAIDNRLHRETLFQGDGTIVSRNTAGAWSAFTASLRRR